MNDWHRYTPWLTKNKLRLKSLKLKSEVFEDCVILLYILERCDCSQLTTLSACFKSFGPRHGRNMLTMVELALQERRRSSEITQVDTVAPYLPLTLQTLKSKAARLGLPDLYNRRVLTRRNLHNAITSLCL